jgi:hypothetical protein
MTKTEKLIWFPREKAVENERNTRDLWPNVAYRMVGWEPNYSKKLAGTTGLEPATSSVTGLRLPFTHSSISFPSIVLHHFGDSAFARS